MALGQRIREARIARNEKQVRFAARLGVATATLAKLERGDRSVSLDLLGRVLELLGHSEDIDALLQTKRGIFDRLEDAQGKKPVRKRARKEPRETPE